MAALLLAVGAGWICGVTEQEQAKPVADAALIAEQLAAYYQQGETEPPWQAALKNLATADAEQRQAAADYLVALLERAHKDEASGAAPWRATPYWGNSGENPARILRGAIAKALAKAPSSPSNLAVVRW